jgi:hypothetical protein
MNRQFQVLVYACREGWEVRYYIADYVEKIKSGDRVNMHGVIAYTCKY